MVADGLITVEEAARRLRVTRKRVYALTAAGVLTPHALGSNRYLLDLAEVEARRGQQILNGRPLDQTSAWAILWLTVAIDTGGLGPWGANLARNTRWRVRNRLGTGKVSESLAAQLPRLRNRARSIRLRAHPGDVARLLGEHVLVRTGVSAAAELGADIVAPDEVEGYVPADKLDELRKKYFLEDSRNPNVHLRVVEDPWPFHPDTRVAPASAVAVDLLDSRDERTQRAGRELLQSLDAVSGGAPRPT